MASGKKFMRNKFFVVYKIINFSLYLNQLQKLFVKCVSQLLSNAITLVA